MRSCAASDCSDGVWKGPDGTGKTFFSELNNNSNPNTQLGRVLPTTPEITFADYPSLGAVTGRYFQYSTIIETDDGTAGPLLKSVEVGPYTRYDGTKPFIVYETALSHRTFTSITESFGGETCSAGLKYQVSTDNTNWKYFNGSAWAVADTNAKTNTAAELATNAASYATLVGRPSNFYIKTFFNTTGSSPCGIDDLIIHSNGFY
ncbi:MAG: hypothetical protein EOP06_04525 [Proteobacteria bacterium]|nr:MAG: hypothetical protein EOP06_04525 [Pseudomonadota bacterium]